MLLTTTGRRTGRLHTVPLPYLADGERKATWERINAEAPWHAGYQQRTSREIPLIRSTRTQSAH